MNRTDIMCQTHGMDKCNISTDILMSLFPLSTMTMLHHAVDRATVHRSAMSHRGAVGVRVGFSSGASCHIDSIEG